MLMYFLKMMSQKSNQICVQLLQTLSILFENIRNETSLCECTVPFKFSLLPREIPLPLETRFLCLGL